MSPAEFARDVTAKLQERGFCALWAGGCVRDQLLGKPPKDYDVATNATPEEVKDVFRRHRTQLVGAAFGVVAVTGPRGAGTIEVATFRRDEGYSDGRHPDRVVYSTPEEDAQRRDFTINGLFYDPIGDRIHDYVGGQDDLSRRVVRCIGEPSARFAEDKLRMLRAIRFTTVLEFDLDRQTLAAIVEHAHQLQQVSAERVGAEVRLILQHPARARGFELLSRSQLWSVMMPEYRLHDDADGEHPLRLAIDALAWLPDGADAPLAIATMFALLHSIQAVPDLKVNELIERLYDRWRWSNRETELIAWLLTQFGQLQHAERRPWPDVQRLLIEPRVKSLLALSRAVLLARDGAEANLESLSWCEEKLQLPPEILNPPALVNGHDLIQQGARPGPQLGQLLRAVRDVQLVDGIHSKDEAIDFARRWLQQNAGH